MKRSLQACVALALAASAVVAAAQTSGSTPASPAKKELIAKLMQLQQPGVEQLSRNMLQQPLGPLMQSAGAMLQQMPADKREATAKSMEAEIKKFVDDNAPMMKERALKLAPATIGAILEERFSEDELRQTLAWLESPTSKKFGQVNGELQKALADKLLAEVGPTLDTRFKALQSNLAKQLGLPPPNAPASTPKAASAPVKK